MNMFVGTQIEEPRDPQEGLEAVVALRRLLEMLDASKVENAYVAGWSWALIAEVLGVSKQASRPQKARQAAQSEVLWRERRRRRSGRMIFKRFTRYAWRCAEAAAEGPENSAATRSGMRIFYSGFSRSTAV